MRRSVASAHAGLQPGCCAVRGERLYLKPTTLTSFSSIPADRRGDVSLVDLELVGSGVQRSTGRDGATR